ncbi:MAG: hypothetical protein CMF69_12415 [Magnetovibrio sp.]|nr:hypothetical protein [Magnetovibrio sp.]
MIETIAVVGTGDMGHAVGRSLIENGYRVVTTLTDRSQHSRDLAAKVGIEDLKSLEAVASEADLLLSIVPPAVATSVATDMVAAMASVGRTLIYVDCNAIAPETASAIGLLVEEGGATFIDAGIIGLAPGKDMTRFYVSGDDTSSMKALDGCGFRVITMSGGGCQGSAIKMCYAALTKGTWTLQLALLLAAEKLGVREILPDEFANSQANDLFRMEQRLPFIPADARRWVGEMEEIAKCFKGVGVPDRFHKGAAEIFRVLAQTPFAKETRDNIDKKRTLNDVIPVYSEYLDGIQK